MVPNDDGDQHLYDTFTGKVLTDDRGEGEREA